MKPFVLLFVLLACLCAAYAQTITQAEWFIRIDPGAGLGNPITVGTPDDSVTLSFTVPTGGLSPGLYRVFVRCRSNSGVWGAPSPRLLTIAPGSGVARLVTAVEYWFDSNAPTFLDVTDDDSITFNQMLSTASLSLGLHKFFLRCRDDLGWWGAPHVALLPVSDSISAVTRLITEVEYWVDGNPPTLVDVEDLAQLSISELVGTSSLTVGLHNVYMRCRDDLGRWGAVERRSLIVTSPFGTSQPRELTAAEFFVNVDPGEGNGVSIPLPQDGTWDEGEETVQTVVTGLPLGLHQVGIRVQDDAGRWSKPVLDSLIVGPILTIRTSGNDVILDWLSGSGADAFHIYRSSTPAGSFAEIDSTTAQTYTDFGIITSNPKSFYQVTFSPRTLSNFRLPNGNSIKKMTQ
jgi:hypothetical protein